ncbi:MAG: hypothetical protein R3Y26_02980 [Rikenellaceae bacterium]
MLKKIVVLAISAVVFCLSGVLHAQTETPTVKASFSRDTILIGDQFTLDVVVEKDMTQVVDFPMFEKGLVGDSIEVLNIMPIDTITGANRRQTLKVSYLMTCFDAGIYNLGNFPVLYADKNIVDTLLSEEVLELFVMTFQIDTTQQSIADITPQLKAPFNFAEFKEYVFNRYVAIALLILIIILAIAYYFYKRRKGSIFSAKPQEPPHITAIKELEKLHDKKLWQNEKHKLYYSCLTDILRQYIDGRYDVNAMEMTSDEILADLKSLVEQKHEYDKLSDLLKMADLVKFAKFIPETDENEVYYNVAYYFVENTKLLPQEVSDDKEEEEEVTK